MGVHVHACVGGTSIGQDIKNLKQGTHVVVGTPGRIFDLIRRGDLSVEHIKYVILDEADQMLEDLFAEQIKAILDNKFPPTTRLALFSATMPQNVIEIAEHYLSNPARMLLPPDEVTLDGIKQYFVELEREDWMSKKEDDMTDDEKLKMKEFLAKEKEYQEKRRKAWEQ